MGPEFWEVLSHLPPGGYVMVLDIGCDMSWYTYIFLLYISYSSPLYQDTSSHLVSCTYPKTRVLAAQSSGDLHSRNGGNGYNDRSSRDFACIVFYV